MTNQLRNISFALILTSIVAYTIPWLVNPSTGLTMGAYDLAEWATIHPQVRFESEYLLTPLLLRIPLACLALTIAFIANRNYILWLRIVCFGIIALYLLPPLEFIDARNDINYLQQFLMVIVISVAGFVGFFAPINQRWRDNVVLCLVSITLVTSTWGVIEARDLMNGFGITPRLGMGIIVIVLVLLMLLGVLLVVNRNKNRVTF